jgi:hypothetical protein
VDVEVKLAKPAFLPPVHIAARIDRQPELPHSPVLVLQLSSLPGLMSLAGMGATMFNMLPRGITMEGDRVNIDLRAIAADERVSFVWTVLERVNVTTTEGRLLLEVDARVRGPLTPAHELREAHPV